MITFYLQKFPDRQKWPIYLLVSFKGAKYRRSIGESVPPKYWNNTKKRAKVVADFTYGNMVNETLDKWETAGLKTLSYFKDHYNPPTKEQFFVQLDKEYYRKETISGPTSLFLSYIDTYIERYKPVRSLVTLKKYYTARNKLEKFQNEKKLQLKFEDIDINFYNLFQHWFYQQGYTDNYFGAIIKVIKQVYREARTVDKIHSLNETDHKDFVTVSQETDSVYLNEEELKKIHRLELTPELILEHFPDMSAFRVQQKIDSLSIARDLFLIGAYTGLRVSDFTRLSDIHFGEHIKIKTVKTGKEAIIPIHPIIKEILDRGFDPNKNIAEQKIRKRVKELAFLAGITEPVLITRHIGGKVVEETVEKYKLISTHTARRSFCTNGYLAGVPTIALMKISGHTKEATFLKYIRVGAKENADILKDHPFFTGQ